MPDPLHVLVAGGGVVGLETLLALRDLAGERVRCTLLTPEPDFVYRPSPSRSRAGAPSATRWTRSRGISAPTSSAAA